ncbi:hypothetical protein [Caenispirillum salinarum]|uniref:hypothetical protein n=1 Tax=Caenispirillum salinarum TaxID=859058 RepID=UPI00384F0A78
MKTRIPAALLAAAALAACTAGEASFGERLRTEGQETAAVGDRWIEGQQMVERGEKLIREGRKDVRSGERKIDKGEDLVEDGREMMARAERTYSPPAD